MAKPTRISTADMITRLTEMTNLEQSPGRCIASRGRVVCAECVRACPSSIPAPQPDSLLDPETAEKCTRCGACVTACPTGALEQSELAFLHRMRTIDAAPVDALRLRCSRCEGGSADVVIGCLRGIGTEMLLRAVARGSRSVTLITATCSECVNGVSGLDEPRDAACEADGMLQALGSPTRVTRETVPFVECEAAGAHDRRAFLEAVRDGGASVLRGMVRDATDIEEPTAPDERGVGTASRSRRIAVNAIGTIAAGMDFRSEAPLPESGAGPLCHQGPEIDRETCMACGDCALFCPTGALRTTVREGEWRLSWSARRCVGCGVCIALCRTRSLSMRDRGLAGIVRPKRLVFYKGAVQECSKCGITFAAGGVHGAATAVPDEGLCGDCRRAADRYPGFY